MKPEMILQADVLDILFENRNKEYGAYALRKEYSQRLFRALGGVLFVLLAGFVVLYWNNNRPSHNKGPIFDPLQDTLKFVDVPVDPPPPKPKLLPPSPPAQTITDPEPVIVPDREVIKPIPTVEDRARSLIGDKTIAGPPISMEGILQPGNGGGGKGNGDPEPEQPAVVEPPVLEVAEVYPEFPGGINAWRRFLSKNLRHPDMEENASKWKFTVVVRFIVNEDGSLSGLEILQSGGTEFDKEVLRVLQKSPKWLAGSNKGKKVKVFHKQPVIFSYDKDE